MGPDGFGPDGLGANGWGPTVGGQRLGANGLGANGSRATDLGPANPLTGWGPTVGGQRLGANGLGPNGSRATDLGPANALTTLTLNSRNVHAQYTGSDHFLFYFRASIFLIFFRTYVIWRDFFLFGVDPVEFLMNLFDLAGFL